MGMREWARPRCSTFVFFRAAEEEAEAETIAPKMIRVKYFALESIVMKRKCSEYQHAADFLHNRLRRVFCCSMVIPPGLPPVALLVQIVLSNEQRPQIKLCLTGESSKSSLSIDRTNALRHLSGLLDNSLFFVTKFRKKRPLRPQKSYNIGINRRLAFAVPFDRYDPVRPRFGWAC